MVKENKNKKMNQNKNKIWMIASGVLVILLIFSVYSGGFSGLNPGGLSKEKATEKALSFINNNLLQGQARARVDSVQEEDGLYKLSLSVAGENFDSYITKDGKLLFPQGINLEDQANNQIPQQQEQQEASTSNLDMKELVDDDPFKGDEDAPVVIVEWSDFECPFCGKFYKQTLGQIEEEYVKTGKVKIVYRDFPLGFHQNAQKAAEAGECADEQGKFWEMHDKLFEDGVEGGVGTFKGYAGEIGLDTAEFNNCLDSGKMASEVAQDLQDGQAAGISGTPGFIINGQLVSGAQPFSVFKEIIEAELNK